MIPSPCASVRAENLVATVDCDADAFCDIVSAVPEIALIVVPAGTLTFPTIDIPRARLVADETVAVGEPLTVVRFAATCMTLAAVPPMLSRPFNPLPR